MASIISAKRQYKQALLDIQKAIALELSSIDDSSFEASGSLSNIAYFLIQKELILLGIQKGESRK